jgi:hypothetical protein
MTNSSSEKEQEHQNCWEFQNCSKEIREGCPAYQTAGRECWFVASHYCLKHKCDFEYCWECPWFKKLNPDFYKKRVVLRRK